MIQKAPLPQGSGAFSLYLQNNNKTVWEATLHIANSADGRKILYDNVGKIKESALPSAKILAVVGSKPLGKTHSDGSKAQNGKNVKHQNFLTDTKVRQLTAEQQDFFKQSVVRDENSNLKVICHGTSKGGHEHS